MNYFFGFKGENIKSELQVPLFQNRAPENQKIKLFEAYVLDNRWKVEEVVNSEKKGDFLILNNDLISNEKIYFLATNKDLSTFDENELKPLNKFTSTSPAYRCNFKVYIDNGGFSSYQAEYPSAMTRIKGSIHSPIGTLLSNKAEKNYLIFKNIYFKPEISEFEAFFVNIKDKKIVKKIVLKTNFSNLITIEKDLINPQIYLVTKEYLGVPSFLSVNNSHLSFEHTHPPHAYFFGNDAYRNVKILKEKINEIII